MASVDPFPRLGVLEARVTAIELQLVVLERYARKIDARAGTAERIALSAQTQAGNNAQRIDRVDSDLDCRVDSTSKRLDALEADNTAADAWRKAVRAHRRIDDLERQIENIDKP